MVSFSSWSAGASFLVSCFVRFRCRCRVCFGDLLIFQTSQSNTSQGIPNQPNSNHSDPFNSTARTVPKHKNTHKPTQHNTHQHNTIQTIPIRSIPSTVRPFTKHQKTTKTHNTNHHNTTQHNTTQHNTTHNNTTQFKPFQSAQFNQRLPHWESQMYVSVTVGSVGRNTPAN